MILQHLFIILGWALFGVLHSILASGRVKAWANTILGSYAYCYRFGYTLFALLQCVVLFLYMGKVDTILLWQVPAALQWVAVIAGCSGFLIMLASIRSYFYTFTGIAAVLKKDTHIPLQAGGLNRYVRHPLYTGTLMVCWGIVFWQPYLSFLVTASCIHLYTLIGMVYEERKLRREYGADYIAYAANVPKLIPRLSSLLPVK